VRMAYLPAAGGVRAERWKLSHCPLPAARDVRPPMTSSPMLAAARSQYLLDLLAQVPDPRKRRGRRHPLAEWHLRAAVSIFMTLEDPYSAGRILTAIAELRSVAGDYAAAADLSRQAVERMPGDAAALTGLAYAQWQEGSPADAEATFGQALRWDGNTALALAGRGRVAEAERELSATFQLDPDRARTRLRAGRMAAILGHWDEVRAEIERALSGQPSLSSVERESAKRIMESIG
jgi:tetratricopeptide (TPR) repeat protein